GLRQFGPADDEYLSRRDEPAVPVHAGSRPGASNNPRSDQEQRPSRPLDDAALQCQPADGFKHRSAKPDNFVWLVHVRIFDHHHIPKESTTDLQSGLAVTLLAESARRSLEH